MITKSLKLFVVFSLFAACFLFSLPSVSAQNGLIKPSKKTEIDNNLNNFAQEAQLEREKNLETIIGTTIKIVLSALGTIFIIYMFVAGNSWMQAGGNEEKVKKATNRIKSLVIGLLIILISYAFSTQVSSLLADVLLN